MRRTVLRCAILCLLALFVSQPRAARGGGAAQPARLRELWLYYPTNLLVEDNIKKLDEIWTQAAAAGYTHVLIADSKFTRLPQMDKRYFDNAEKVKQIATRLNLTLVPAVFNVGYSNDSLSADPNLVEGIPVKDSVFEARGGQLRIVPDPAVKFAKVAFKDDIVTVDGDTATVKGSASGAPARLTYALKLPPRRCYHVSVKVKTDDYHGTPEIKVLSGNREHQFEYLRAAPTQDWTEHHVVFNTLDSREQNVYFGDWSHPKTGTLQWKEWRIEEAPLVNVLRRPGTPLTVTGEDGRAYAEGTDFDKIVDPNMGVHPWPGEYQSWHEPPTVKTTLKDGTRARVSWYHPALVYGGQVSACVAEPKMMQAMTEQAKGVMKLFPVGGYMMSHDEFRCFGWDESCRKTGKTPGQMLADNVRQCRDVLKPAKAYVWSDMFDPTHNAVKGPYYLVNGPWTGSWEGLDKDVVIVNWNYDKRDESLKFFADRGTPQLIAGFYDGGQDAKAWLASAAKVKGVTGFMYTTWRGDYSQIAAFAKECGGK